MSPNRFSSLVLSSMISLSFVGLSSEAKANVFFEDDVIDEPIEFLACGGSGGGGGGAGAKKRAEREAMMQELQQLAEPEESNKKTESNGRVRIYEEEQNRLNPIQGERRKLAIEESKQKQIDAAKDAEKAQEASKFKKTLETIKTVIAQIFLALWRFIGL